MLFHKVVIPIIFCIVIFLPFVFFVNPNITIIEFFSFRYIEIANLTMMTILAFFAAYWVALKSSREVLKKELCLLLITEARTILIQLKGISLQALKESNVDGKLILTLFKRFNNKLHHINEISKDLVENKYLDKIIKYFKDIKDLLDEKTYNMNFDKFGHYEKASKLFEELDTLFDELRLQII